MARERFSFHDPRMADIMPTYSRDKTLTQFEVDRHGKWLALSRVHAVICLLCECRAWDSTHRRKGDKVFPKLEVRSVFEREFDAHDKGQAYRVTMFGLGCPDSRINSPKQVWTMWQLWTNNALCWDYTQYAEKRAEVEQHALTHKRLNDPKFAWHTKAIGTPIEGETFGQGRVLQLLNNGEGDAASKQLPGVIELAGS